MWFKFVSVHFSSYISPWKGIKFQDDLLHFSENECNLALSSERFCQTANVMCLTAAHVCVPFTIERVPDRNVMACLRDEQS